MTKVCTVWSLTSWLWSLFHQQQWAQRVGIVSFCHRRKLKQKQKETKHQHWNKTQEKLCWLKHLWPMLLFKVGQEAGERTLSLIVIFQTYFSNCLIHYNYVQLFMNLLLCSVLLSKLGLISATGHLWLFENVERVKNQTFFQKQIVIWI